MKGGRMTNNQCALLCSLIKSHSTGFFTDKIIYEQAEDFLDWLDIADEEIEAHKQ